VRPTIRSASAPTRSMSGGNAQKVLLARELGGAPGASSPTVLVVAAPTRGLDVGATAFVRDLLDARRAEGCAILLVSEDLDEVRALSDRIVVLSGGRIVLERATEEAGLTELGLAMAGEVAAAGSGDAAGGAA
jgi:general nucleoside transport system ATP-binding protein